MSAASNGEAKTLTDQVYHQIRRDIIEGTIAPDSKLHIEQLKKQYDVGATPIREALSRLSSDGFVITQGQRGFQAAPVSALDLADVTELRIMLEKRALRKSIELGDDQWESRVVATFYQLTKAEQNKDTIDAEEWEMRNRDFHHALISSCSSVWLTRFYNLLYDQHKRYRNLSLAANAKADTKRDLHAEHQRIFDAALARDADTACAEAEIHIRKTAEVTLAVMQQGEEQQLRISA